MGRHLASLMAAAPLALALALTSTLGELGCGATPGKSSSAAWSAGSADHAAERAAPNTVGRGVTRKVPLGNKRRVIVFVWDGLRPDSVDESNTPNLRGLRDRAGVNFSDQHSVYPTFTMINAAAFATGAYPDKHGFFGNYEYQPGPRGKSFDGSEIDFSQPVFTEDYGVLTAIDRYYGGESGGDRLLLADTLFQAAHRAGLRTATVGKNGSAYLQDYRPDDERSLLLDEATVLPLSLARELKSAGFALPALSPLYPYGSGEPLTLEPSNGDPTATTKANVRLLADGVTPDPRAALGSPHSAKNAYLMRVFVEYLLPKFAPELSLIWLRNPDSTEHQFGPGSPNYVAALRAQDELLGGLLKKLDELGWRAQTDLLVVSDHGHSSVAGDSALFPLRALQGDADGHAEVGAPDPSGYSVSGEVRTADLLTRAGFRHVYDGGVCLLDPVLSGVRKDGSRLYATRKGAAAECRAPYSTPSFRVPTPLPPDSVVIAANGGSEYLYLLDHSQSRAEELVLALQERRQYGVIFAHSRYGAVAGTLPLPLIRVEGARLSPPTPDLIVGFDWNSEAVVGGARDVPGTEYASAQRYRGMHGSFSPRDVHNTLIASGPDFKTGFVDRWPSGNVDVAPTVAALLGLPFTAPDGRVLSEAFSRSHDEWDVEPYTEISRSIRLPKSCAADDPGCSHPSGPVDYQATLFEKVLRSRDGKTSYRYFDRAGVTRK